MVGRIEVLHAQIVVEAGCRSSLLDDGSVCIEIGVGSKGALRVILHGSATANSCSPSTESIAFSNGCLGSIEVESANGHILFYLLCTNDGLAVGIDIGQGVEGLAYEIGYPLHRDVVVGNRDGNCGLLVVASIGDGTYSTSFSSHIGKRIVLANHVVSLEELDVSYIVVANNLKDVFNIILGAISFERGQDGNFLLLTTECTFDDDICKAYLLGIAQAVEVDQQSAFAFSNGSTRYVECKIGWGIALVVTVGNLLCSQRNGSAIGVNPGEIQLTTIGTKTCGFGRNLGRGELQTGVGTEQELDSIVCTRSRLVGNGGLETGLRHTAVS